MPAPSVPGMIGNGAFCPHGRHDPSRTSPSQLPTPAESRAMRTSRGPGLGTGRRWVVSTEGGPNRSIAAAFIVGGIVDCRAPAATRFAMASPSGLGPVLRSEKETSDFSFSNPSLEASGLGGNRFPARGSRSPGFGPFIGPLIPPAVGPLADPWPFRAFAVFGGESPRAWRPRFRRPQGRRRTRPHRAEARGEPEAAGRWGG